MNLQNNLKIYNLSCLTFVQGLKYKWISAQKSRLMIGYKSLIKIFKYVVTHIFFSVLSFLLLIGLTTHFCVRDQVLQV
jgi:hypothetical protein